jgi:hypothetical protein
LLAPFALLFALIVPYCLWLFVRAIFEAPWPGQIMMYACGILIAGVWGIYVFENALDPIWMQSAGFVTRVLALIVVAHVLWLTLRGRPDDLIERRRATRLFFVGIIALYIAAVPVVELEIQIETSVYLKSDDDIATEYTASCITGALGKVISIRFV